MPDKNHKKPRRAPLNSLVQRMRPRACIDWIEIRATLDRPTNFHSLQRFIKQAVASDRDPWVQPLLEGAGGASQWFSVRIQDPPESAAAWRSLESAIKRRFGDASRIGLDKIEVSIDYYSRTGSTNDIEEMTLLLMRGLEADRSERRQFFNKNWVSKRWLWANV